MPNPVLNEKVFEWCTRLSLSRFNGGDSVSGLFNRRGQGPQLHQIGIENDCRFFGRKIDRRVIHAVDALERFLNAPNTRGASHSRNTEREVRAWGLDR